uniref:Copia protein n=1 Tax=Tanacetum cinerariifolium TaxID=118510 RepID=A0A6L2K621_TANCI|nr:copia protein [Tanacetum cinerariifolium]
MQEELNQFAANDVWELVPQPNNMTIIGTKWVFRNKLDENGIVSRNKARLVAQGYNQQEGIDYDETYAPVARLESIRILLAYACALDFKLFQMDVKSTFLNGFINEEWSLDDLLFSVPTGGPYQTNPPSPDDIKLLVQIERQGVVTRIHHEQEIVVEDNQILTHPELSSHLSVLYDRVMYPLAAQQEQNTRKDYGIRIGRSSTSSSSSFGQPSSSHPHDDDNDGNDEGTSRASTLSPTRFIDSLTNEVPESLKTHQILTQTLNLFILVKPKYSTVNLKALDEGYYSKNYVRKFLRALHPKRRAKVTTIEESKDLTSLSLDELIGNLKVHEMIIKKDSKIVKAKGERKYLALKAKKESNDGECSNSRSEKEEYAMATFQRSRNDKNIKSDRKCFRCGDPNHLVGEYPKPPKDKNQRAFVGGSWSDSGEEDDEKAKDKTCLVAHTSNVKIMDQDSAHMVVASKVPMLKPGEFEIWRIRIEQYIQMIDYALWEVIENCATCQKHKLWKKSKGFQAQVQAYRTWLLCLHQIIAALIEQLILLKQLILLMEFLTASTQVNAAFFSNIDNLSDVVICAFLASQPNSPQLVHKDLEQIHPDDMEKIDLRWQLAMLTIRAKRFLKKTGKKLTINGNKTISFDKSNVKRYNCHKRGHFARKCRAPRNQDYKHKEISRRSVVVETTASTALVSCDGLGGYDWSDQENEGPNYSLMAYSSTNYDKKIVDNCKKRLGYENYNAVPPPYTRNFMPPKPDLSFTRLDEFINKPVVENYEAKSSEKEPKVVRKNDDALIIEEWVLDDEEENVTQPKIKKTIKPSIVKKEFIKSNNMKIKLLEKLINKLSIIVKTLIDIEAIKETETM